MDPETCTSETHFIKCSGRLALGNLKTMHQIYRHVRRVVHDKMSAKRASDNLDSLLNSKPIYCVWARCAIAFCLCVWRVICRYVHRRIWCACAQLAAAHSGCEEPTVRECFRVSTFLLLSLVFWIYLLQDQHCDLHFVSGSRVRQHSQRVVLLHGDFVCWNRLHPSRLPHS